jgi:hypothetical protein
MIPDMKPASHSWIAIRRLPVVLAITTLTALLAAPPDPSPAREPTPARLDVLALRAPPAGHYALNLQAHGPVRWLNLRVTNGVATGVKASDAALQGLRGEFQLVGNGVFLISLANPNHRATQFWVFQPDGSALVKEFPDRGEKQVARPVPDDTLTGAGEAAKPR